MKNSLNLLKRLIAIKSISTDTRQHSEMQKAVRLIASELKTLGFKIKVIGQSHPLIYAHYDAQAKETLGLYAHYDVQPADQLHKWQSQPFQVTIKQTKIIGRGTADDKIHIVQIISAIKEILKNAPLKKNITLLFEGEEEIGSINFERYLKEIIKELSKIKAFYILDSSVKDKQTPMIEYGLRGLMCYVLKITLTNKDLHSGLAGNLVANPANVLAKFIASLKNKDEKITLPGFYEKVKPLSQQEKKLLKAQASKAEKIKQFGVKDLFVPKGSEYYYASKVLPAFDVHSFNSGFADIGFKTIIPSQALIKFSFRLVPNQNPIKINKTLQIYVKKFFSKYPLNYELRNLGFSKAFVTNLNNQYIIKTATVFNRHFKNPTVYNRSGGSIVAAEILSRLFHKPIIITGFASAASNIHGPNEFIEFGLFKKGIKVLTDLLAN